LLLRDARVGDRLVDIRIEDGRIAQVGAIGGEGIDLEGRWVVPGLWDEHTHFTQWALARTHVDVSAARSAREAADLMRGRSGELLVGAGFRDGLWPDSPEATVLDAATGATPTVLLSADLHSVWLNSAALTRFGFPGHPSGLLREDDAFAVAEALDRIPDAELDRAVGIAAAEAASRGVVGIVDLEMEWSVDAWLRRRSVGFDALRVEVGVYRAHLGRAIARGYRTGLQLDELVSFGRFKVLIDGSLNTRTAYCYEEFPGGGHGMLTVPPEELLPLMRQATHAGIASSVHALGDHAVTLALDAFAACGVPGRIEHAQLITASDLPRFAVLGVTASVQPEHAMDDRDVADHYWAGRTQRVIPVRSLLDAGADVVFGSDAPVAPLDPWITMAAAVQRSRDGREAWHPEQRVSVAEAMAASTRSRIEAGQPADLAILDADPARTELRGMPVFATLLGGRFTHGELPQ
jgi:predicted amidohydrolase YtcJ